MNLEGGGFRGQVRVVLVDHGRGFVAQQGGGVGVRHPLLQQVGGEGVPEPVHDAPAFQFHVLVPQRLPQPLHRLAPGGVRPDVPPVVSEDRPHGVLGDQLLREGEHRRVQVNHQRLAALVRRLVFVHDPDGGSFVKVPGLDRGDDVRPGAAVPAGDQEVPEPGVGVFDHRLVVGRGDERVLPTADDLGDVQLLRERVVGGVAEPGRPVQRGRDADHEPPDRAFRPVRVLLQDAINVMRLQVPDGDLAVNRAERFKVVPVGLVGLRLLVPLDPVQELVCYDLERICVPGGIHPGEGHQVVPPPMGLFLLRPQGNLASLVLDIPLTTGFSKPRL